MEDGLPTADGAPASVVVPLLARPNMPVSMSAAEWRDRFRSLPKDTKLHLVSSSFGEAAPDRTEREREYRTLFESDAASITFINSEANVMVNLPRSSEAYAVFKAGLVNYAAQLALRHAKRGVRVNNVSPSAIIFPGGSWDRQREQDTDLYKNAIAMSDFHRLGTAQEIARAAVFLASPASSWTTNVNLRVDGGTVKTPNY